MTQYMTLPDGRNFEYFISGATDGFPLFWIHGTPGSYVPAEGIPEVCGRKGVRCITMSRAGYGESTRKIERKVVDCVPDIEALRDHLGIKEFIVGGWSGGGPHALACAARLSGCRGALVVAGCTPYDLYTAEGLDWLEGQGEDNVEEFHASLKGEAALQEFIKPQRDGMLQSDAAGMVQVMDSLLPEVDRKAMLDNPAVGQNIVDTFHAGLKHNADGWVDDSLSFVEPWGFDLAEIKVPISLWQGSADLMVPFSQGEWFATHLPQDKLMTHLLDGEGHMSIFLGKTDEMIEEVLASRY